MHYALSNKLGVIECLGFESMLSTINYQPSTINHELSTWLLNLSRKTTPTLRLRQRATPPEEGNVPLFLGGGEMIER